MKQAGYSISGNRITIGKKQNRFFKSREIKGKIKTLTVKRDSQGDIYFIIVTDAEHKKLQATTTEIAGLDFGLKDFLVADDGSRVEAPEPPKKSLNKLKKANQNLSRKEKGSNNRAKAKKALFGSTGPSGTRGRTSTSRLPWC